MSNFMKIRLVGAVLFHAERTDGRTDRLNRNGVTNCRFSRIAQLSHVTLAPHVLALFEEVSVDLLRYSDLLVS